ncbi:hypothetical protein EVAR_75457_1 [Eumeta japonica]|uniref:Uncharacterized protein n=1 Tax=Eumeta variegata TaxID=151549 RepID=A0A4C1TKZ7_EUMVA|nr:hypothetical protein EVAR_75457_1 [Eumeta japonica]
MRKVVSENKKAWLDLLSLQRTTTECKEKNILKDKLKDGEITDDNVTATEYMIHDENESEITMNEIMKVLKRMEVRKAAGYDSFVRDVEGRWGYNGKPSVPGL